MAGWQRALKKFCPQLEERLNIEHHITSLHEAVPGGFLTNKEQQDIMSQSTDYNRVRKLVDILATKDEEAFEAFTTFLKTISLSELAEEMEKAAKEAVQVLDDFRDQFIKEMDAKAVVWELLHRGLISKGDEERIRQTYEPKQRNQFLHWTLKEKCTEEAFITVCDIIIAVEGNPKMAALGEAMKKKLGDSMPQKETHSNTTTVETTSCNGRSLSWATTKSGAVEARRAVLGKVQQRQSSGTNVFGVLVAGTNESGKSTLIRNLFDVDFKRKHCEIQRLTTRVDGVSVTLYISYDTMYSKDSKQHLKQLQRLIQDKHISLIIYCFPVNETRLRPEPFETFWIYSTAGVDWSRAVLALTFSDRLVAPKHEREHKDFSEESFFRQKRKEWMEGIKREMVKKGVITKGSEDAIRMHSTTEDREDLLPDGQEWYGPLWKDIEMLLAL